MHQLLFIDSGWSAAGRGGAAAYLIILLRWGTPSVSEYPNKNKMLCYLMKSLATGRVSEPVCGWFESRVTVSGQSLALPTLRNQQLIYGPWSPAEPLPLWALCVFQGRLEKGDLLHRYSCARFHDTLVFVTAY